MIIIIIVLILFLLMLYSMCRISSKCSRIEEQQIIESDGVKK